MGNERFAYSNYLVRSTFTKAVTVFNIYDPMGNVAFHTKRKAFKFKSDIRIYTGEDMREEVLAILARHVLDFAAAYDVVDSLSGTKVGGLKLKGMRSMVRDEWQILDAFDNEIGTIQEDSMGRAMARRLLRKSVVPQQFTGMVGGRQVCSFKQIFNPFVTNINLDFSMDTVGALDRRLGMAAGVLLCMVEGRDG